MLTIDIIADDVTMYGITITANRDLESEWLRLLKVATDCKPGTYEEVTITDHERDCECGDELGMDDRCKVLRIVNL